MDTIKTIGRALVAGAASLLFFRYVGRFSSDQSFALAVAAWVVYMKFWEADKRYFEPHRIWIEVNWYELLLDNGLVKDIDEWNRAYAVASRAPEYNVLRDGFSFTVLRPGELIFRNDHKDFSKDVDYEEWIQGLTYRSAGSGEAWIRILVGIGDEHIGRLGYEIRITAAASGAQADERGQVRVAFLPRDAFCFYWEDKGKFDEKRWTRLRATQERLLEANGWKIADDSTPYDIVDVPDRIEHKYFTVRHRRI